MGNYKDRPLIDYLPTVLKEVREFQALMHGEQPEVFNFFNEIQIALDNQFILTLTEYGVKRWEKILSIVPKATYTLEERRFTILTLLSKQLPYTYRMLEQILTELSGEGNFEILLNADEYELKVRLELYSSNNAEIVAQMIRQICPANLVCIVANDTVRETTIHVIGAMFQSKIYNSSRVVDLTIYDDVQTDFTILNSGASIQSTIHNFKSVVDLTDNIEHIKENTIHAPGQTLVSKTITKRTTITL